MGNAVSVAIDKKMIRHAVSGVISVIMNYYNYFWNNIAVVPALLIMLFLSGCSSLDISDAEKAMHEGNYAEAYCIWRQLADQGHPIAMYNIGWMYHNGFGLVVDDIKASNWWHNAAESGLEEAEQALGMLYYYGGKGVPRDLERSAEYLMPGAARGDEEAALLLETFIGQLDPRMRERFQMLIEKQAEVQSEDLLNNLEGQTLVVSVKRANLRAQPSTNAPIVTSLLMGAVVGELERKPDWVKVAYAPDKDPAWIHASLVKAKD